MSPHRAELHAIIEVFSKAIEGLGKRTTPAVLERWGLVVHRAMTGTARMFHTNSHVFNLARGADPIETLAALFHDVVYLQVDQGLPKILEPQVLPYLSFEGGGVRVRSFDLAAEPAAALVLAIFGVEAGATLSVFNGANELASALVAAYELGKVISPRDLAEVSACIEATIPFRGKDAQGNGPLERLDARLAALDVERSLGLGEAEREKAVQRAVWVANRDVENFADPDVGQFLDNTWKLLPETNPSLRQADVYSVSEYRTALQKMEGFLSGLPAERVFHNFHGVPDEAAFAALRSRAAINLDLSTRYLRLKLLAIAHVEGLALATGGDAPLELFMGGLRESSDRLEQFLPTPPNTQPTDVHPTLWALVDKGRAGESDFDLKQAPLATFLYRHLGESGVPGAVEQARRFFKGEIDGAGFLRTQKPELVKSIAEAASHLVSTRREALLAIANAPSA
jgi:hypothetical protein